MPSSPNTQSNMAATADLEIDSSQISNQARTLASTLCRHMGVDEARRVCEDNQWHGVLAALNVMHQN